jgi:hypothetical protein
MAFLIIGVGVSGIAATWINPADSNVKFSSNKESIPKGTKAIDENYFCKICDVQV